MCSLNLHKSGFFMSPVLLPLHPVCAPLHFKHRVCSSVCVQSSPTPGWRKKALNSSRMTNTSVCLPCGTTALWKCVCALRSMSSCVCLLVCSVCVCACPSPVWTRQTWSIFGIDGCVTLFCEVATHTTVSITNSLLRIRTSNICTENLQFLPLDSRRSLKWHCQQGICYSALRNHQNPNYGGTSLKCFPPVWRWASDAPASPAAPFFLLSASPL